MPDDWNDDWNLDFGGFAVTDTSVIQKPVNCVLAGEQKIVDRFREQSGAVRVTTKTQPKRTIADLGDFFKV